MEYGERSPQKQMSCLVHTTVINSPPGGSDGKASACNVGDSGSIPRWGRSPGEGNGNPVQYACLENPMDGGAWRATVHGVTKSRTRLSDFASAFFHFHCHLLAEYVNCRFFQEIGPFGFIFRKDKPKVIQEQQSTFPEI